jgi:hypothetical protein
VTRSGLEEAAHKAVKFVILMKRRPGMTRAEFVDYHRTHHAKTFMADPTIRRLCRKYAVSHPIRSDVDGLPEPPSDGIAEVRFDDVGDLREPFSSDTYMANVRTDELKFIDLENSQNLVTEERPVWPEQPAGTQGGRHPADAATAPVMEHGSRRGRAHAVDTWDGATGAGRMPSRMIWTARSRWASSR